MAKQVADVKFYEYVMRSIGSGTAACDWQQLPSTRKVALRDLHNETGNNVPYSLANTSLQKKGNGVKVLGFKRERSTCSNPQCQDFAFCNCSKENIVYVRKKTGAESFNLNVSSDEGYSCPDTEKELPDTGYHEQRNSDVPQIALFGSSIPLTSMQSCESLETSLPNALGKPNDNVTSEPNNAAYSSADDSCDVCIQHWKARFVRLQSFLKECDEANRDDYIHMLRSLSPSGRSKHAVELEKRAIHLLLEEGKELHRMKALNVLGKPISNNLITSDSQSHLTQTTSRQ